MKYRILKFLKRLSGLIVVVWPVLFIAMIFGGEFKSSDSLWGERLVFGIFSFFASVLITLLWIFLCWIEQRVMARLK
jgi:hypothetical protein